MKRFKYSPEIPPDLIKDIFESRTTPGLGWPQGKPLPDLNQFVDRSIVNEVLKEMGRKPGGGSDELLERCIVRRLHRAKDLGTNFITGDLCVWVFQGMM